MDYAKIGLKCGIEIHQQLDTNKLFCSCPSILRVDEPDIVVKRKLHAVAGELGEIDEAAAYEAGREREFIYEAYSDTTCLVELDEEPPHNINEEALKIALQISLLLNSRILPITQIMRKTVIDGSNTAGFQRTLLVAKDGYVEIGRKKIGIATICLEEDAARIIQVKEKEVVYRLDRLGIPLVEIATKAEISTPQEAKETALALGEMLRVCKIKRGIGTIRQDVNLSIKGGARTEIKGVQKPELISKVIEKEVARQLELIKKKEKVEKSVRRANLDGSTTFLRPLPGAARMYPETDLPLIKISDEMINKIKAALPKLKSEIRLELKEKGLHEELIKILLKENKLEEFRELLQIYNKPDLVAKILCLFPKEISAHEKISLKEIEEKITLDTIETILHAVKEKKISPSQVKQVMLEIAKGKSIKEALKVEIDYEKIEKEIQKILKEKPGLSINAYIGLVLKKFKASGKEIMEILKKYIKEK